MHYVSFHIKNFKGIKDTKIKLSEESKLGVFAFVGLNESGKTTILETIHSFSPDHATSELVGGDESSGVPYDQRIPRHLISSFSGDVSILAEIALTEDDKHVLNRMLRDQHEFEIKIDSAPRFVFLERQQSYKEGNFISNFFSLRSNFEVKTLNQKKWREPDRIQRKAIRDIIYDLAPDIAYFPTFVFNFPERIFLTKERGGKVSAFYRKVFQDILDYDNKGLTIEKSIIDRIRSEEKIVPWPSFFQIMSSGSDTDKIQHVMDRASSVVTEVVFGRWNQIFGENALNKEVVIQYHMAAGERKSDDGATVQSNEHDLYIKFQVKDGTRRFDVNDRSLGFRWFFSFLLFTQFRTARKSIRPVLFLFDEPASNLHAAAQQKLIDSFPQIAVKENALAYTTHSHYMIEPKWLEQTFIVTNTSDSPNNSIVDSLSRSDESLDIKAERYRDFVNRHPSQTSYFQPILDRLDVKPSKFESDRSSIVLEGKSDYYILRYAESLFGINELPLVPALGAGTFGALMSISIGWGLKNLFVLDGDKQGVTEKRRYQSEYNLKAGTIVLLTELSEGINKIEDLLDGEAKNLIRANAQSAQELTKKQILRFFQESLSSNNCIELGDEFEKNSRDILQKLRETFGAL